jgi:hypothetical protein
MLATLAIASFNADAKGNAYATPADTRAGVAAMIQIGGVNTRFNDVIATLLPKAVVGIQIISVQFLPNYAPIELEKLKLGVSQRIPLPEDGLAQDRYGSTLRGLPIDWVCPFGLAKTPPVETGNLALSATAFKKYV